MSTDTHLLEKENCEDDADYPRQKETSILLVIRAAVKQEECLSSYIKHVYVFYKNSSTFILTRAVMFVAAISIFVTGLIQYHHCDMEPEIPLFLVLEGAAIIFKTCIFIIKSCNNRSPDDGERSSLDTCSDVTSLFLVLWTLSGSVWVFGTYSRVDLVNLQDSFYCDKVVYLCSLSFLLVIYTYVIAMVLFLTVLCIYYKHARGQQGQSAYNNFT